MRLKMHFVIAQGRIDGLRNYTDKLEQMIAKETKQFLAGIDTVKALVEPEHTDEYAIQIAEEFEQLGKTFPRIFRSSLFVLCASDFEHILIDLAKVVQRSLGLGLLVSDMRDEGINKARSYLKKAIGWDFPDDSPEWEQITLLASLRNVFAHNNGRLTDERGKAQVEGLARVWAPDIRVDEAKYIQLSANFVPRALDVYREFLDQLSACVT